MGRFIEIAIDAAQLGAGQAQAVIRACPVDIYVLDAEDALTTVPSREDECILCAQCLVHGSGAISVRRRYGSCAALSPVGGQDA